MPVDVDDVWSDLPGPPQSHCRKCLAAIDHDWATAWGTDSNSAKIYSSVLCAIFTAANLGREPTSKLPEVVFHARSIPAIAPRFVAYNTALLRRILRENGP